MTLFCCRAGGHGQQDDDADARSDSGDSAFDTDTGSRPSVGISASTTRRAAPAFSGITPRSSGDFSGTGPAYNRSAHPVDMHASVHGAMSGYSSSVSVGYGGAASSVRSVSVGRRVSGGNKPAFGSTLTLARSEYNGPAPGTTRPRSTSRGPYGGRRIVGSEEVGGIGGMSDAASVGASTRSGKRGDQFP